MNEGILQFRMHAVHSIFLGGQILELEFDLIFPRMLQRCSFQNGISFFSMCTVALDLSVFV